MIGNPLHSIRVIKGRAKRKDSDRHKYLHNFHLRTVYSISGKCGFHGVSHTSVDVFINTLQYSSKITTHAFSQPMGQLDPN